jgi:hypothetical protein
MQERVLLLFSWPDFDRAAVVEEKSDNECKPSSRGNLKCASKIATFGIDICATFEKQFYHRGIW